MGTKITDQNSYEAWCQKGQIDAASKAKEIARDLIKNHHPDIVDEGQNELIAEVLKEAEIKLKEKE